MTKRLEKLTETQKEILKTLPLGKDVKREDILKYLKKEGVKIDDAELKNELEGLIKYGSLRSSFEDKKDEEGMTYNLSRGIGSGYRNQRKLQGKSNIIQDTYKLYKRIFGSVFIVFGIGLVIYNGAFISGAAISFKEGTSALYLGVISFILGIALFLAPSKKKKNFKK